MSAREIRNRESGRQLTDLLQSAFAAELLLPSGHLWIVSPWISDIPLLDNTAGQFSVLAPEWDRSLIHLSQVLTHLADRRTVVHVATRDETHNIAFHTAMADRARQLQDRIFLHLDYGRGLHEKRLLADHWYLEGSVNFTFSGITLKEEKALFHLDETTIAENRIFMARRWPDTQP